MTPTTQNHPLLCWKPLVLLCLFTLMQSPLLHAGEMREWKSKKGTSIQAELVEVAGDSVKLKTKQGKIIKVKISALSDDDQKYIKNQSSNKDTPKGDDKDQEKQEIDSETQPKLTKRLPVLTDGKGKGYHAYYEGKGYIAYVNAGGGLIIHLRDDKTVKKDWAIKILPDAIIDGGANGRKKFWITKMLEHGEAKANAEKVRFVGERTGHVKCEVIYEFGPETITTWFRSEISSNTPKNMVHRMRHLIGSINKIDGSTEFAKKHKLKRSLVEGGRHRENFYDAVSLRGNTKEFEMTGPVFGDKKITFKRGRSKNIELRPYNYPKTPARNGFAIYLTKDDITSNKHDQEKVTITIK